MAFNSTTYHMNKNRRIAWERLHEARALVAEAAAQPDASFAASLRMIAAGRARSARYAMQSHLFWRRIRAIERGETGE